MLADHGMRRLQRLGTLLDFMLGIVLNVSFAAMITLICMEVFLRNWQGASLAWYDEVGRLLLVWATFLGAAVATKDRSHYAVDFLETGLSSRIKKLFVLISDVVVAIVGLVFVVQGMVLLQLESEQHLAATGLSLIWRDAAFVGGSALILIFAIRHLFIDIGQSPPSR